MNPCACFDFTMKATEDNNHDDLCSFLPEIAKKWAFQLEQGETGYKHYQGRLSLKVKKRLLEICSKLKTTIMKDAHISVTSKENQNNDFYVTKEDTRVLGPWTDKENDSIYIPRQIAIINQLKSWQLSIKNTVNTFDTRTINVLINESGNIGKSTLISYLHCHRLARRLPPVNDAKDLMRIVMDAPTSNCYLIDMPKAMNKERLYGMYCAIECIKDGFAYDDRYHYREKLFDCPCIWIFTNTVPDMSLLSRDRWVLWKVENETLILRGATL